MDNINYEQEARRLFRELFYESWMDEEEWDEIERLTLAQTNTTYADMAAALEQGVKNGYSLEMQRAFFISPDEGGHGRPNSK